MEEIKIGEYVRTRKGIARIIECKWKDEKRGNIYQVDENGTIRPDSSFYEYIAESDILNHQNKPINLIEVGDYVNGERMDIVERDENGHVYYLQNIELPSVNKNEIKSIVTKEQFKSMEYNIGE